MIKREWLLERNRSLSPRQLACAYGLQCCLSLSAAVAMTLRGAWYVLIFSFLEIALLGWALLYHARHAGDHEHIALGDNFLLVETVDGRRTAEIRFDPRTTRIVPPTRTRGLIRLQGDKVQVDIGRFVSEGRRRQVAAELQLQLALSLPRR